MSNDNSVSILSELSDLSKVDNLKNKQFCNPLNIRNFYKEQPNLPNIGQEKKAISNLDSLCKGVIPKSFKFNTL